jgi:hypothetical protein
MSSCERHANIKLEFRSTSGTSPLPSVLVDVTNIQNTTPIKPVSEDTGIHANISESQFVPRKRTNTNHVITPNKPLRQTTLNRQAKRQSLLEPLKDGPGKRPRKSLRKSMRQSIISVAVEEAVPLPEHLTFTGVVVPKPEETVQSITIDNDDSSGQQKLRRKSVRKSTRSSRASTPKCEEPVNHQPNIFSDTKEGFTKSPVAAAVVGFHPPRLTGKTLEETASTTEMAITSMVALHEVEILTGELQDVASSAEALVIETESSDSTLSSIESIADDEEATSHELTSEGIQNPPELVGFSCPHEVTAKEIELDEKTATETLNPLLESEQTVGEVEYQNIDTDRLEETNENEESKDENVSANEITKNHSQQQESSAVPDLEISQMKEQSTEITPELCTENSAVETGVETLHITAKELATAEVTENTLSTETASSYDHDEADMLRNFLTRVKANKAAKKASPKRKRSLPHSPLRIPLGEMDNNLSPSSLQQAGEFDLAPLSPSKRNTSGGAAGPGDEAEEPRSCRRSTRTRLPVKSGLPIAAPSLIPMRRLGQDDTTVTLKRNEEKELAALTRVNTRKNKGGALSALEVLAKKVEEKDDPAMRQRLLKEVFDTKIEQGKDSKAKKRKSVAWAEELAQFQTLTKGKVEAKKDDMEKDKSLQTTEEKKPGSVRVGVRSKIALGMAANGTPAPKRKGRGRL